MVEHNGKWQKATIKYIDGHQQIGVHLWLDPNKRTSDMLDNGKMFLSIIWENRYYSINKTQILWVNEHIGIRDERH